MAENDLRCNNLRTCRKLLSDEGRAVVTTCSHIFCVNCAEQLFTSSKECPACQTPLTEENDVVVCSLNPTNDYRTSVLSGLSPSVVMEIATRALSFWQYQVTQEGAFQAMLLQRCQEEFQSASSQAGAALRDLKLINKKADTLARELDQQKRKSHDLAEALREKEREYGKLKTHYDKLKRKAILLPMASADASVASFNLGAMNVGMASIGSASGGGVGAFDVLGGRVHLPSQQQTPTHRAPSSQQNGPWAPTPTSRLSTSTAPFTSHTQPFLSATSAVSSSRQQTSQQQQPQPSERRSSKHRSDVSVGLPASKRSGRAMSRSYSESGSEPGDESGFGPVAMTGAVGGGGGGGSWRGGKNGHEKVGSGGGGSGNGGGRLGWTGGGGASRSGGGGTIVSQEFQQHHHHSTAAQSTRRFA